MAEVEKTINSKNLEKGKIWREKRRWKNERLGEITQCREETEKQDCT